MVKRSKSLTTIISVMMFLTPLWPLGVKAATVIENVRMGVHPSFTRLVLDSRGDRPSSVGPPSDQGVSIGYSELRMAAGLQRLYKDVSSAVTAVVVLENNGGRQVHIPFRYKETTLKYDFMEADPPR